MRGYLAVTPKGLSDFYSSGNIDAAKAFATTRYFFEEYPEVDEEEREFELSWLAALESRALQGSDESLGFVLALNLTSKQTGEEIGNTVSLLTLVEWSQVDSLLVAESADAEMSWYASQEIETQLAQWIA